MVSLLFQWSLPVFLFLQLPGEAEMHSNSKSLHPFYVSVTEFNYNSRESNLEISCKMFADDFENSLKRQYKTKIDLTHPQDVKQLEKIIFDYLQKRLQLKVNNNTVALEFVGFEKDSEAVWCYIQVSNVKPVSRLEVRNTLLYEAFDTQINIMHVQSGGQRKSAKLSNPEPSWTFEFN